MQQQDIQVNSNEIPACPGCDESQWRVLQVISRESDLLKVDSQGDLIVAPHDESTYVQKLKLECKKCLSVFVPQSGIPARVEQTPEYVEAYAVNTGLHEWPAVVRGDYA